MSEPDKSENREGRAPIPEKASGKKPYIKPAFECEKVFETMALACGKISATQQQCRLNRRNS